MQTTAQNPSSAVTRARSFDPSTIYDRILVPIDTTESTNVALFAALDLKHRFGGRVVLFHVADGSGNNSFLAGNGSSVTLGDICKDGLRRLRMMMDAVAPEDANEVEYDVVGSTEIVDGVLAAANRHKATMVVLGVDAAADDPHMLRSRSEKIAQSLNCAVLQLHPPEKPQHPLDTR